MSASRVKVGAVLLLALAAWAAGTGLAVFSSRPAAPVATATTPPPAARFRSRDDQAEVVRREPQRQSQRFLDLQPHANFKLTEDFARQRNNLAGLPPGEQLLGGVKFNIGEGLILLKGNGIDRPERVEGIRVGETFSRLHILHATHWSAGKKDAVVGFYTLNYDDQSWETLPIVYGQNVSNWWYMECEGPPPAVVAWKGENEDATRTNRARLHLYLTSWKNPHPARRVVSIDFTSTNSTAAPFCVAMTTEE
jgi:hypothetical protein